MYSQSFRFLGLVVLLLVCCCFGSAQDYSPDKVKISAAFSNSEYYDLFQTQYDQGLTAELDARVFKKSGVRLGVVFQFNRSNLGSETPVDIYSFGPQLSYDLFKGYVSPFGRALFGYQTSYFGGDKTFARTYGVGVDVNLGNVFIRPVVIDYIRTEGFNSPATQRFSAGVGMRF